MLKAPIKNLEQPIGIDNFIVTFVNNIKTLINVSGNILISIIANRNGKYNKFVGGLMI